MGTGVLEGLGSGGRAREARRWFRGWAWWTAVGSKLALHHKWLAGPGAGAAAKHCRNTGRMGEWVTSPTEHFTGVGTTPADLRTVGCTAGIDRWTKRSTREPWVIPVLAEADSTAPSQSRPLPQP